MQRYLRARLCVFLFIQCFTWGAWYVSMGTYLLKVLKFSEQQVGEAYGAFAIGAMISPFIVGLIADRYIATEKLLAFLGFVGGLLLFLLARLDKFELFYPTLIVYCSTYAPTLALANSMALHHLDDAKHDFPRVKIFFSLGWIAGGLTLSLLHAEQTATQFHLAGWMSMAMGAFALMMPHTPPKKVGEDVTLSEILGLDALALLRRPSFALFVASMFLICIPLYFYFVNMGIFLTELGWKDFAGKLTLAQVSDVVFLFLLPILLKRFGYKATIGLGIVAWVTRYYILAASARDHDHAMPLILLAIAIHGICYDFLFVAGQLYVDAEANERIRGAAQGLIAFIIWGLGMFVGTTLAGKVMQHYRTGQSDQILGHDWYHIWSIPAFGALVVLIAFLLFFRETKAVAVVTEEAMDIGSLP